MTNISKILIIIILAVQISSCTERIEIDLEEGNIRLVVEGAVTTDTAIHKVILSTTSSYYYSRKAPVVSGASVSIRAGAKDITLREAEPGVYQTDSTFFGIEEETYTLYIKLASPVGGHTEYSASTRMSKMVTLDSVKLVFQPDWSEDGFWEVRGYLQDPPSADYYRFLIYRNGKMISDTLDEWFVTDDRFFNGAYVEGASIAFLDQGSEEEKLNQGDLLTVEVNCLTKEYTGFIWDAQSELRGTNPLFSGPPANVKGNISNGAIGFFASYTTSRARVMAGIIK